jgi:hypothetical protein
MSESTQLTPEQVDAMQVELATLKQAHQEVLAKRQKDKARITALESATTDLQGKLSESAGTINELTIGGPLKAMAESMSTVPELFLEQFSKHFKLEMVKGALTLLSTGGEPLLGNDKKPIPFERQALTKLLTTGDDARTKTFKAITIVSHASGGSNIAANSRSKRAQLQRFQFGLK